MSFEAAQLGLIWDFAVRLPFVAAVGRTVLMGEVTEAALVATGERFSLTPCVRFSALPVFV